MTPVHVPEQRKILNKLKKLADWLSGFFLILGWLIGIVLAKGLWTLLAIVFPPYGWYLIVERCMTTIGWI